jgi:hypothetical protein
VGAVALIARSWAIILLPPEGVGITRPITSVRILLGGQSDARARGGKAQRPGIAGPGCEAFRVWRVPRLWWTCLTRASG